ncbi:MAG TPA: dockerin type I domain-containing protein [Candidatus Dormibacteraeota bacterium]|nr:dockerin type I domain-containing protein [Candidatus Dormibacteraeota bacterium]
MRDSRIRRRAGRGAGWIVAATLVVAVSLPADARAMCCLCRDCSGGDAFCVDGLATSLVCSTFCFNNGCPSTVFDSADTCSGGCDGAPAAPTASVSATPTLTPTATATGTATGSATASSTPTATATVTATASASSTPSATANDSPTATVTATSTASATPTSTPSSTPSATPSATAGPPAPLSGHISYYTGGGPVPDVDVVQLGDTPGSVMTNAGGHYGFSTAGPGNVTVQPQKNGQFNAAITSLDAVTILQAIVNQTTLTPEQEHAADVTGNGSFSTLDATRILQFQAGTITRFAAADLCQSDWLFLPVPSPTPNQTLVNPVVGFGSCQQGAIALTSFTPPLAGRDFHAILLGDVTGNWHP